MVYDVSEPRFRCLWLEIFPFYLVPCDIPEQKLPRKGQELGVGNAGMSRELRNFSDSLKDTHLTSLRVPYT